MTTLFNNSFDSTTNSDSDDDFMVDSIINSDRKPCNSEQTNIKPKYIPSWKKEAKCTKIFSGVKKNMNMVSNIKFPLKRCLSNTTNNNINRDGQYTKFIKLESDKNLAVKVTNSRSYSRDKYFNNSTKQENMYHYDLFNDCNSNASSSTESDKTHSVESSPSCILLNDPIITSVVLNEKRFDSSSDSGFKLPYDGNFNNIPTSFDKSYFSTSIDDNLLRPIRYKQLPVVSNHVSSGFLTKSRNNSLTLNSYNKIGSIKRSRSTGLDQQTLTHERLVRSNESLETRKYVPALTIVSDNTPDCTHSSTSITPVARNYHQTKFQHNNNGHNKRKHLLQFIIDLLKEGHSCVNWSNKKDKEFFIAEPEKLALLWATYKNNNKMTFDSLARSLRLYYAPKKLERISGKKNHYRILNLSHEIAFNL